MELTEGKSTELTEDLIKKIAEVNANNPYVDITPSALGFGLPGTDYSGIFTKPGEVVIYAAKAYTHKDKERVVGHTGSSGGVSVRVAKGVSVRSGTSNSRVIRENVRTYNGGDFIVTNQRVIFSSENDPFEFPLEKISTFNRDGKYLVIQSGRTSKRVEFNPCIVPFVHTAVKGAKDAMDQGVDIAETYNIPLTPSQQALCDEARERAVKKHVHAKSFNKSKSSGGNKVVPIVIAVIVMVLFIGGLRNMNKKDGEGSVQQTGVSTATETEQSENQVMTVPELIEAKGRPTIYSKYSEATSF